MTPKLSETELLARDAQRDLNVELLKSIAEVKARKIAKENPNLPYPVIRDILIADKKRVIGDYSFNRLSAALSPQLVRKGLYNVIT